MTGVFLVHLLYSNRIENIQVSSLKENFLLGQRGGNFFRGGGGDGPIMGIQFFMVRGKECALKKTENAKWVMKIFSYETERIPLIKLRGAALGHSLLLLFLPVLWISKYFRRLLTFYPVPPGNK